MPKVNSHIVIVRSNIPKLSSMGLLSAEMIQKTLTKKYSLVSLAHIDTFADLSYLVQRRPDLVLLGVKYIPMRDFSSNNLRKLWIGDFLATNHINFIGSPGSAIEASFNKHQAKKLVAAAGLPTAKFFLARPGQFSATSKLPLAFPFFVKPVSEGGGQGIDANSVVHDFRQFDKKVRRIYEEFSTEALAEEYLSGREFSVAMLASGDEAVTAMPLEMIAGQNANGDRLLGLQTKEEDKEQSIAVSEPELNQRLINKATKIFKVLGARDYARIDMRMDYSGTLHFLEANLIPGIADHKFVSYFNRACLLNENMDYGAIIHGLVDIGFKRQEVFA